MKNTGITGHSLICNEERWIWYAINSVIDYVDKLLLFDTGSTDKTVKIIKTIKSPKIVLKQKGKVNKKEYARLRQQMLDQTETSWFMVLDGDEVWTKSAITELVDMIKTAPKKTDAIVVPQWICQGDVFHYNEQVERLLQDRSGRLGFWLPRAWRMMPDLHVIGEYGIESYADKNGVNVSDWNLDRLQYTREKFFHMSFLSRSSTVAKDREVMMRAFKTRFSRGRQFPKSMHYPEVFYWHRPAIVPSPWRRIAWQDYVVGLYYRSINLFNRLFK